MRLRLNFHIKKQVFPIAKSAAMQYNYVASFNKLYIYWHWAFVLPQKKYSVVFLYYQVHSAERFFMGSGTYSHIYSCSFNTAVAQYVRKMGQIFLY